MKKIKNTFYLLLLQEKGEIHQRQHKQFSFELFYISTIFVRDLVFQSLAPGQFYLLKPNTRIWESWLTDLKKKKKNPTLSKDNVFCIKKVKIVATFKKNHGRLVQEVNTESNRTYP